MAGAAVSPSTVGSPAAGTSPITTNSSLFDSVHDHTHVQSDWDHINDSSTKEEEDIHCLLEDMAKDLFSGDMSAIERPKWTVDSSGKDVIISFDDSREKVWKLARNEIKAYRARICELTSKTFEELDPLEDLVELYLGAATPLMQVLQSSLKLSYEKVAHFLGTFCIHKASGLSVKELYDDEDDDLVNLSRLMPQDEYEDVWKKIGKGSSSDGRNKKQFWNKF